MKISTGTVRRRIARMEAEGVITREFRYNSKYGGQESNAYRFDGLLQKATPHAQERIDLASEAAPGGGGSPQPQESGSQTRGGQLGGEPEKMSDMVALVERFGFPTVTATALLYIVLRGELHFRYPRQQGCS